MFRGEYLPNKRSDPMPFLSTFRRLFCCLLLSASLTAQTGVDADAIATASPSSPGTVREDIRMNSGGSFDRDAFRERAKSRGVAVRSFDTPAPVSNGFYLITGVFKEGKNLRRAIRKLKRKGLKAGSFVNPENGLNYVYANRYDNPGEALDAASSRFQGAYRGDVWILINGEVGNNSKTQSEAQPGMQSEPGTNSPRKQKSGTPSRIPITQLQKADHYFNVMWYAEAARLYEEVLSRGEQTYTFDILRKAGDAHYFNTDMERAYHWYNILYEEYRDQLSAPNLFKYAHALKGNGKYGRARRIMRLYDKLTEADSTAAGIRHDLQLREIILDNILNRESAYTVRNLENVNSKYSEFAPMFYGEDAVVFASSVDSAFFHTKRYRWNDQPYLDLYVARLNEEADDLEHAVKFSKKLNTKYHEAGVTFSPDRQTVYFTRNNYGKRLRRDHNGVSHLKLYVSRKIGDQWTEAEELPFNGESYSTGHPALSPDGKQLYFVSDMPGTIGETDIFVVDVYENGGYSEPRNLGPEINTAQKEMFPYINGEKLYFSSNGHIGLGGLDVFQVVFDETEGFLEVENLGQPINSKMDDFSYIVDEKTQKGFFASNRAGGKGFDDLYSFQRLLPEEANENAIAGVVTDRVTGEAIPQALVTLLDENNRKLKEIVTEADGSFVFQELDSNNRYRVVADKESYAEASRDVATRDNEQVDVELPMQKLRENIVVENGVRKLKTEPIYFDFDKHNIRPDAAVELDKLVALMQENPTMVIAIESHTDSRGSRAYNELLSDRRAKSTRAYLIENGISPNRIQSAMGYGESRLLNGCDGSIRCSVQQHQLNRRSEFIVVSM